LYTVDPVIAPTELSGMEDAVRAEVNVRSNAGANEDSRPVADLDRGEHSGLETFTTHGKPQGGV